MLVCIPGSEPNKYALYEVEGSVRAFLGIVKYKEEKIYFSSAPKAEISLEKLCEVLSLIKEKEKCRKKFSAEG